jgi:hypothetical protein
VNVRSNLGSRQNTAANYRFLLCCQQLRSAIAVESGPPGCADRTERRCEPSAAKLERTAAVVMMITVMTVITALFLIAVLAE